MKTKISFLLIILSIAAGSIYYYGCSSKSNPVNSSGAIGSAQDYMPSNQNSTFNILLSGTTTTYDSLGGVKSIQQISNQVFKGLYGAQTTYRACSVIPVYAYFDNVNPSLIGYCGVGANGVSTGDLVVMGTNTTDAIVSILPASLALNNEWTINPTGSTNNPVRIKLVQSLDSYTNPAGKTYSGVIKMQVTYNDSSSSTYSDNSGYSSYAYVRILSSIDVYFAKGAGIIGAQINNMEILSKSYMSYFGSSYSSYERQVSTGSAGIY